MMSIITLIAIYIAVVGVHSSKCSVETETLCVNQVNDDGFGDITNQYAFAMAEFKGSLYVATLNALNGLPGMALFFLGLPFATNGVQIHKGNLNGNSHIWSWTPVVTNGNGDPDNYGIRKLIVVGDYLYAVTANHVSGFEVWRTFDGSNWEIIMADGFGDDDNTSGRGLTVYDGYLYVGGENRKTGAKIWRRSIQEDGEFIAEAWEAVVTDGLGDIGNYWFPDFVEYKGWMYAGTLNPKGMQLYRTMDGVEYENIFVGGNGKLAESAAMKLYVYNDKLYIGTMNFKDGASLYVNTDDEGTVFEAVFSGGNGNRMNAYVWYMQEFNDRLYVATFKMGAEFDLFSAVQPGEEEWITETDEGFGYESHYGIRSMAVFEGKLMIGSATAQLDLSCIVFEAEVNDNVSVGGQGEGFVKGKGGKTNDATVNSNRFFTSSIVGDYGFDVNTLLLGLILLSIMSFVFIYYKRTDPNQFKKQINYDGDQ